LGDFSVAGLQNTSLGQGQEQDLTKEYITGAIVPVLDRLIEKAKIEATKVISGLLEHDRFEIPRGSPSNQISDLQSTVRDLISADEAYESLSRDQTFMKFVRNMCIVTARSLNLKATELVNNPLMAEAFIEHLVAHYNLLSEAGVSESVIKFYGHSLSIFAIDKILRDSTEIFGADPKTRGLVRTTASLVFSKRYGSVIEAKEFYDRTLAEADKVFGADPKTESLVHTAANLVFMNKYPSVAEAKKFYDRAFVEADRVFGADPETKSLVRTAAGLAFSKRYGSVIKAKKFYDRTLAEAGKVFGADPETRSLTRTAANQVFIKHHKSVAEAKKFYDRAFVEADRVFGANPETKSLVRTVANRLFTRHYRSVAEAKSFYDQNRRL
jgi:hypothetical protein